MLRHFLHLYLLLRVILLASSATFDLTTDKDSEWEKISLSLLNDNNDDIMFFEETTRISQYNLPGTVCDYEYIPSSFNSLSPFSSGESKTLSEPLLKDYLTFESGGLISEAFPRPKPLRLSGAEGCVWDMIEMPPEADPISNSIFDGKYEGTLNKDFMDWSAEESCSFTSMANKHPEDKGKYEDDSEEEEINLCDHLGSHLSINGVYQPAIVGSVDLGVDICSQDYFQIIETVGEGAFGIVRSAIHRNTGLKVALKYLHGNSNNDHVFARHEECLLNRMGNFKFTPKHYCTFIDPKGSIVIAMELIENGVELFSMIYDEQVITLDGVETDEYTYQYSKGDIANWAAECIASFIYMHSLKISFRDFKPENVIITDTGHIKIVDFGFASDFDRPHYMSADKLLGTPIYHPPEYITPKRSKTSDSRRTYDDPAADWYALGVVLYETAFREFPIENIGDLSKTEIDRLIRLGFHCDKGGKWADFCALINGFFQVDPAKRLGVIEGSEAIFRSSPFLQSTKISQLIDSIKIR